MRLESFITGGGKRLRGRSFNGIAFKQGCFGGADCFFIKQEISGQTESCAG
ncbi:unnamed protein product [Lepidochelys kempii]